MSAPQETGIAPVALREALPTWARVAALSFGGPAGQIAVMHRLVVDEKRWVSEERFLHAMSYCMLLPGPEAQQLATYLGWLIHGTRGGLVAGLLFIVPGFASLFLLSVLYATLHDTALVAGIFYGIKPAVIAVVLSALMRIGGRALRAPWKKWTAAAAFVAIFFFGVPFPLIILAAAIAGFAAGSLGSKVDPPAPADVRAAPPLGRTLRTALVWLAVWFVPVAALAWAAPVGTVFVQEALFFSKAAVVTFGGAYAVLSYVAHQAVEVFAWLAPGEMLNGLGMAETTPGPLIQVVQFVGFMGAYRFPGPFSPLVSGAIGSVVTAWVTFAPCFLFVFVGAPYAEYLRGRRRLHGAMTAITAAIVGVVLNLAVWFSVHTLFKEVHTTRMGLLTLLQPVVTSVDIPSVVLAVLATVAMLRFRAGMLQVLFGAAVAGVAWSLV